jgi:hypothetical protein
MAKKTLAEHVIEVMGEFGCTQIDQGELDMLSQAYSRFGGNVSHPLNRNAAVMNAVRRSGKFEPDGYINAHDSMGRAAKLAVFRLKS